MADMGDKVCPYCKADLNESEYVNGYKSAGLQPTPGDVAICYACSMPSIFNFSMVLEPFDPKDMPADAQELLKEALLETAARVRPPLN